MNQNENYDQTVPAFGYELLRSVLIPELLGKEQGTILYWAGRNLARQYPLETTEEIINFFERAGWGSLSIETENKNSITFMLAADLISTRLDQDKHAPFTLEAGFLAQQLQTAKNRFADAQSSLKRGKTVAITVQWDPKDVVNNEASRRSRSSRR